MSDVAFFKIIFFFFFWTISGASPWRVFYQRLVFLDFKNENNFFLDLMGFLSGRKAFAKLLSPPQELKVGRCSDHSSNVKGTFRKSEM